MRASDKLSIIRKLISTSKYQKAQFHRLENRPAFIESIGHSESIAGVLEDAALRGGVSEYFGSMGLSIALSSISLNRLRWWTYVLAPVDISAVPFFSTVALRKCGSTDLPSARMGGFLPDRYLRFSRIF